MRALRLLTALSMLAVPTGCGGVQDDDDGAGDGDADADADADTDADGDADDERRAAIVQYCNCMDANCPDAFSSEDECLIDAAAVPRLGEPADQSGDSIRCRIFHCTAAEFAPDVHCPHARGAPPCAD